MSLIIAYILMYEFSYPWWAYAIVFVVWLFSLGMTEQ
jgi:hypothetical protein